MKIFAPAVIGTGIGVFALAVTVGSVAIFGPTATPSNGLTVSVDTVQTSLYLMILGWPIAAALGGMSGAAFGLIHTDIANSSALEPPTPMDSHTDRSKQNALATRIERKQRSPRTNSFNQPA